MFQREDRLREVYRKYYCFKIANDVGAGISENCKGRASVYLFLFIHKTLQATSDIA